MKNGINIAPIQKPPICANQATPGLLGSVKLAWIICVLSQINIKIPAGILITVMKKKIKTKVDTLALGNKSKYELKIPETAPDAPIIGMLEKGDIKACVSAAAIPHNM